MAVVKTALRRMQIQMQQERGAANFTATVETQQWRNILHLRIPGTVTAGYPEYPEVLKRRCFVVVTSS